MQNQDWIDLIKLFPPQLHDNLVVSTQNGNEINVQVIIRIETDYLVVRGRAAGSTDEGRPFFIPYNQISLIGLYRPVKDDQILAMFGVTSPAAGEAEPAEQQQVETVEETAPPPEAKPQAVEKPTPLPTPVPPPPNPTGARPSLANKAAILERLRTTGRGGQQTPKPEK